MVIIQPECSPWHIKGFPTGFPTGFPRDFPNVSGWWYTYHSEKYECVSWDCDIPNLWKIIIHSCSSHHQPGVFSHWESKVFPSPNPNPVSPPGADQCFQILWPRRSGSRPRTHGRYPGGFGVVVLPWKFIWLVTYHCDSYTVHNV